MVTTISGVSPHPAHQRVPREEESGSWAPGVPWPLCIGHSDIGPWAHVQTTLSAAAPPVAARDWHSTTDAATVLGVTRAALSALLNERANLSPEMALRIEKAFGVSMETLMRMQNSYDIAQVRKRSGKIKVTAYKADQTAA